MEKYGEFDDVTRSLEVLYDNISDVDIDNRELITDLVMLHENTHFEQSMTSTLGSFLSFLKFFRKNSIRIFFYSNRVLNLNIKWEKPLKYWAEDYIESEQNCKQVEMTRALLFDIQTISTTITYFEGGFSQQHLKDNWDEIVSSIGSCYDIYLQGIKDTIQNKFNYEELLTTNREFWFKSHNCFILNNEEHFMSYRDLIECNAALVELNYFHARKDLLKKMSGKEITINSEYFQEIANHKPIKLFNTILKCSNLTPKTIKTINHLIFVAINPPIAPNFSCCWNENLSLHFDIHPGLRFYNLCKLLRDLFGTAEEIPGNDFWHEMVFKCFGWGTIVELNEELQTTFIDTLEKVESNLKRYGYIPQGSLTDVELLVYQYLEASELKAKYPNYFIDPSYYRFSHLNKIRILEEINSKLHCPLMYDLNMKKYRANIGGLNKMEYDSNEKDFVSIIREFKKPTEYLKQVALNAMKESVFWRLDNQLLYKDKNFDLSIFDKFDIDKELVQEILDLYIKENELDRDIFS